MLTGSYWPIDTRRLIGAPLYRVLRTINAKIHSKLLPLGTNAATHPNANITTNHKQLAVICKLKSAKL